MQKLLLLSILGLVLGNIIFSSCAVKQKPEHSFTLIRLSMIDSVTEQNKGWAISSYLYADLNKDSVFSSKNGFDEFHEAGSHQSSSPVTGIIEGFSKDSTIIKFLQRSKSKAAYKKVTQGPAQGYVGRQPYILVLKEGSNQQVINFNDYEHDYIIQYVIWHLEGLQNNKNLKPTAEDIDEGKTLVPLLLRPELASISQMGVERGDAELFDGIE